ncbi:hypothetical protein BGX27_007119 [Mortierella sp. AM989]|nr:hypothetical protein BGX27_007119 [Mortierella sp. AM989]
MVGNQMRCDKSVVQTHFMTSKMPAPNCASLFATSPLNSPKLLPPPFSSASSTPASSTFYPNPVAPEISTSSCSPVNFMATSHTLEFPTKDRKCQGGDDEGFEPQSVTTSNLLNLTTSGKFSKYLVQPPPTGSDGLRYESLDTAALSNKGIQLSLPTGDAKFCPVSSMEFAEYFLPESTMVSPQAQSGARKRSMLVSRIRKVFIKPTMSSSAKDQQEQLEATKRQQHSLEDIASLSSSLSPPGSELDQHRGSVSSSSSNESMSVGQAEFGINSPLTSPEISPTGSPKLKYALPEMHRFKNTQSFAAGVEAQFNASTTPTTPNAAKQSEKRLSLEPTPTRTVKKRLSFASITSFFNPRGSDAATAIATKKKQQRSSSVPNVESPLAIVGRQISGFQRRHSLNDMPECPGSKQLTSLPPQKLVISPWDKDLASAQTAAVTAEMLATTQSRTPSEKVGESIKKSKIYGVFGKQSKKKNKSGSENSTVIAADSSVAVNSSTKPLRPTLTQHHQRSPSLSKVPSNRSSIYEQGHNPQREQQQQQQQQGLSSIKRSSYSGPSVSLPQEAGPGSRRASEEQQSARLGERIVGPTRHRRQSSIAGRQATQQGYYPVLDRKQRHSIRYSSDSERDSMYYLESPTTSCQAGGLMVQRPAEYEIMNAPPKPRTTPVSTALSSPTQTPSYQISALSHTSPRRDSFTSISGTEDGQFPLSMQESSMSAHHSHHRNSIHQTENIGGIVFNNSSHCSSIVSTTSPAPRQPVDHSIHMEFSGHTSTATPRSATLPLSSVTPTSPTPSSSNSLPSCFKPASSKQIQFSTAQPIIHQTWAPDQYDRTSDPNITAHRLTQAIAQKIKLELNQFKSQEMIVHQDSRTHTHFFV